MTNRQKRAYSEPEALKAILKRALSGLKFRLDCGHHITFNAALGNDLIIRNGKTLKFVCTECEY